MKSLRAILDSIMVYEALHKRKLFLDSFGEGLEVFGVLGFIQKFTDELKPAFVSSGILISDDVLKILKPRPSDDVMTVDEKRVYKFLEHYIEQCTDIRKLIAKVNRQATLK